MKDRKAICEEADFVLVCTRVRSLLRSFCRRRSPGMGRQALVPTAERRGCASGTKRKTRKTPMICLSILCRLNKRNPHVILVHLLGYYLYLPLECHRQRHLTLTGSQQGVTSGLCIYRITNHESGWS